MSEKTKAIIFDIDGTAIDSPIQKLPTQRLVKAVKDLEDVYYMCAATGRGWTYVKDILHGLSLTEPCVISGGTRICKPVSGDILWQSDIDQTSVLKILEVLKTKYSDYNMLYNDYAEEDYLSGGVKQSELNITEPVYFMELVFVPEVAAREIVDDILKIPGVTCTVVVAQREGLKDLHISNQSATKEHAIAELLKILKIDRANTIGVGDGHNDIHLFNAVEYKVAMGNAVPELKERADKILAGVTEDGLAQYLEGLSK